MTFSVYSTTPIPRRSKFSHRLGLFTVLLLSLLLAWHYSEIPPEQLLTSLQLTISNLNQHPLGPLYLIVIHALSGLFLLPYTAMVLLTGYLYDPVTALLINFFGCAANASLLFAVGRWLGSVPLLSDNHRFIQNLHQRLQRRSLLTVVILRNLPMAPFVVISLLCGTIKVRFQTFLLGTQLGSGPFLIALTLFGDQLQHTLQDPGLSTLSWLLGSALLVIGVALVAERWAKDRGQYSD